MSNVRPQRLAAAAAVAAGAFALLTWATAATASGHAAKGPTIVTVGSTDLGKILIDSRGRTLYLYTPDKKGKSSCNGQCASIWPPLLTTGKMRAAHGVKSSLLGTIKRTDGTTQVTYAGHPLYFFAQDAAPGDVNGQGVQSIWYALSVTGSKVTTPPPPATIQLGQTSLGSVLVNPGGLTLYMFTPDSGAVSTCYGGCAATWPPLLLNGGTLRAGAGLQTSLLGTMQRTDGSTQITYGGHPLYVYSKDTGAGQTNGQGIAAKWYVLSAAGTPVGAP